VPTILLPDVTSRIKEEAYLYSAGFAHPIEPFPAAKRTAFTLEKNPAATGQDVDVPASKVLRESYSLGSCTL
jgi:hypothetical protein